MFDRFSEFANLLSYLDRSEAGLLTDCRFDWRVSELVALKWQHVDLETGRLRVIRSKGSDDSVQPLSGAEIRALRRTKREQQTGERYVFVSERAAPLTANGFFKTLRRAALSIGMDDVHPTARVRLQARKPRCRHPHARRLSRPSPNRQHRALHQDGCASV